MNPNSQAAVSGLQTLLQSVGVAPVAPTGWIKITGSDRVRWLNGMVTNSVQDLKPGQGAYTFALNAQGRIQGDGIVWAGEDVIFLETDAAQTTPLMEMLDRFIIMDDVELADESEQRFGLRIVGPAASQHLSDLGLEVPEGPYGWHLRPWKGQDVCVQAVKNHFEVWATSQQTSEDLMAALVANGAMQATSADFESLRILQGVPKFGTDIRDRDLPQETNQTHALHFNKGCYLGQEIVERIRSRGAVHRTFHAFTLTGETPAPGTPLEVEGKAVGELTSIDGDRALGYIRREFLERGLPITYAGGTASPS